MQEEIKLVQLFKEIQQGNKIAFDELFLNYYGKLLIFAKQYTKQSEIAEEITSELFVKLWLKRENLSNVLHPQVYLYTAIKNACLNLIRSTKKSSVLLLEETATLQQETVAVGYSTIEDKELVSLLHAAVSALPEQRRIIFRLIKEDGLKANAVAQILGLSKRTVENQLYKALKTLADSVSHYLGYHPQAKSAKKQGLLELSILFL